MVIFNDKKWISEIIESHDCTVFKNVKLLIKYLVKYYYPNFKDKTVKEYHRFILDEMLKFNYPIYQYEEWKYEDFVKKTCKDALDGKFSVFLRDYDSIQITQGEMNIIAKAENDQQKKLLFTLYVLAKLYPYRSGWVNFKESTIFKLANIHLNFKERHFLINDLYRQELLQLNHDISKIGYKVELVEDSPAILSVPNPNGYNQPDKFGNQYLGFVRKGWTICHKCGRLIKKHSPNQKYCKKCNEEEYKKQNNEHNKAKQKKHSDSGKTSKTA